MQNRGEQVFRVRAALRKLQGQCDHREVRQSNHKIARAPFEQPPPVLAGQER